MPRRLDLPAGSYSIVVRGFSKANPFLVLSTTKHYVDFDLAPDWTGLNNDVHGNDFGWRPPNRDGRPAGEIGGKLVRLRSNCYFADTNLTRRFSFNDRIGASGSFRLADIRTDQVGPNKACKFFIGHFAKGANSSEIVGLEFKVLGADQVLVGLGQIDDKRRVTGGGVNSDYINVKSNEVHSFRYVYDPQAGDHGILAVHIDGLSALDATLSENVRNCAVRFNSFGMGYFSDVNADAVSSVSLQSFVGFVNYSGSDIFGQSVNQAAMDGSNGAIVHVGSRLGERRSDEFPKQSHAGPLGFVAGSFEYTSRTTNMTTNEGGVR